jgi:hypothetical protein
VGPLAYTCTFPSGPRQVSALIAGTFPATRTAGQQIRPTGTGVTVTMPQTAVSDLTKLNAATVTATGSLTIEATQAGRPAAVAWPGLSAPVTPVPAKGSLTLSTSGAAAPVTVTAPGDVSFAAAGLSLVLTPHQANGTATRPPVMRVPCTLNPGQEATLATVVVAGATGTRASGRPVAVQNSSPITAGRGTNFCPHLSKALKLNPRFPLPPIPPGSVINHSPGLPPYCAYATGFSDVRKLNGAALLGPGLTNISPFLLSAFNFTKNYFQQRSAAELSYHGLREFPPAKATLLSFGFMPTSATMQLTGIGTINVVTVGPLTACTGPSCKPTLTTISARLSLRIYNVLVNGVPLNVGPNCHTSPFDLVLTGSSQSKPPYEFSTGGPLTGTVTIPAFSNCGVGENLDPVFNAAISGPGNFTRLTQGRVCEQGIHPLYCPPKPRRPIR